MKTVKVSFQENDLDVLDRQAASKGVSRSEFIRGKVLAASGGKGFTHQDYARLISRACRSVDLPRAQVERLVNIVFIEVMEPRAEEASPR